MPAEWIAPLANAAGLAFASAAGTAAWDSARAGLARLFGRGGQARQDLALRWADDAANDIAQAPSGSAEQVRARYAATWQQRLADLIEEFPDLREQVGDWSERTRGQLPASAQQWATNVIANDYSHVYIGRDMTVYNYRDPAGVDE
jgi:hypothetical protein